MVDDAIISRAKQSNKTAKPNTTNLHTHGLHVSGEAPYDYVLYNVEPGDSQTYTYIIQNDHLPGHLWYQAPRTGVAAADAAAAATSAAEPPQPPLRLQGRRVLPRGLQAQGRLGARRLAREVSRPRSPRSPTA